MKLSKITADAIHNVLSTAKLVKINELLVTQNSVGGYNPDKTAFILSEIQLNDDFGTMGISRPDVFLNRLNLIRNDDTLDMTVMVDGDGDDKIAREINFKTKSMKLQYRSCIPKFITTPKKINDNDEYTVPLSEKDVDLIAKASSTCASKNIKIINSNGELTYELVDDSDDVVSIYSEDKVDVEDGGSNNFSFSYVLDMFNPLVKNNTETSYTIGKRGILKIQLNGLTFYMFPQA